MVNIIKSKIFLISLFALLIFPFLASADTLSQKVNFFVDPDFDLNNRSQLPGHFAKNYEPPLFLF